MHVRTRGFCWLVLLLLISAATAAQTPQTVRVEGFLSDLSGGSGVPANGMFSMRFDLYDADLAGSLVVGVGPLSVEAVDGLYSVDLPFTAADFDGSERFLEITVEGEILNPRIRFVSQPFAYVADKLDGFDASDLDESAEVAAVAAALAGHEQSADPHPGSAQPTFKTHLVPNGTSPVAESPDDTLTWSSVAPLTLTGSSATDTITIEVPRWEISASGNDTFVLKGQDADSQISVYGTCSNNPTLNDDYTETDRYTCSDDSDCAPGGTCSGSDLIVLNPGRCAPDTPDCFEFELNNSPIRQQCGDCGPGGPCLAGCFMGERGTYYAYFQQPDHFLAGIAIRQGYDTPAVLDIISSGRYKSLRVFSSDLILPDSWIDDGGRWTTVKAIRISGQTKVNDVTGRLVTGTLSDTHWTNGRWSQPMLDVFADVYGANALFRSNIGSDADGRGFNVGFLRRTGYCEDGVTECRCKPVQTGSYTCAPCVGIGSGECRAVFGLMVGAESELMWSDTIKGPIHGGNCSTDTGIECVEDWQCPIGQTCLVDGRKTAPPADTKLYRDGYGRLLLEGQLKTDGKVLRIDEQIPSGNDPLGGIHASALFDYHGGASFSDNPVVGVWGEAGTRGETAGTPVSWSYVAGLKGVGKLAGDGGGGTMARLSGLEAEARYGNADGGSAINVTDGNGIVVRTPDPPGTGVSVGKHTGISIEDQDCGDRYASCSALTIEPQSTGSGNRPEDSAIHIAGGDWDTGSLRIGDDHFLWVQASNNTLRYSRGAPAASNDGARIYNASPTSDGWGHTMWFDAEEPSFDSGDEVCVSRGLACQYVQRQGPTYGPPDPGGCATTQAASSGTLWLAYCGGRND